MLQVIDSVHKWKLIRASLKDKTIGFVATMGCLHTGHKKLITESLSNNNITVVSLFINPHQFNNSSDLSSYPITIDEDLNLLRELKVDYVLTPTQKMLYPDNYKFKIVENNIANTLEGKARPGFFEGVLTVVLKLLLLVNPNIAYFGEKDFEQYELIKNLAQAFLLDCKIEMISTARETSGLAYSSRNKRLTHQEKKLAANIYYYLKHEPNQHKLKLSLEKKGFQVEYIQERQKRRFIAARINNIRLIDNIKLT
jgi:pantoate--beta-alanine ligase